MHLNHNRNTQWSRKHKHIMTL